MAEDLRRFVVFGDLSKKHVSKAADGFSRFASDKAEVSAVCDITECRAEALGGADYAVVFGGDGTIISAARQLSQSGVPVIGVNLGKLGFLAEFGLNEIERNFQDILSGNCAVEERMMLNCTITSGGRQSFRAVAINDVFITSGPPFRLIELNIFVDEQSVADCVSDGLVIATPTGSTAYNLSAGGPIISGDVRAMVITPICPHSLTFRPIVINSQSRVRVVGLRVNEGTTVSIDGQSSCRMGLDDVVEIVRHEGIFEVVNNPERNQWDTLARKLGWAAKLNYLDRGKK